MSRGALLAALLTVTGCGSPVRASARLTAWSARHPVSITATVLGRDFRPVAAADLVRVGALSIDREVCGRDGELDLSRATDDAVAASAGEAVVNVHAVVVPSMEDRPECGRVRVRGDVVRRRPGAIARGDLERGCARGRADLCIGLADQLLAGEGAAPDGPRAVEALDRGCTRGSAWSCFHLGALLADGRVAPRDLARAMAVVDQACRAELGEACVLQASLLAREDNPARDVARARAIAEHRCQRGSMQGCYVLAEIVAGAPEGAPLAARLLERACIGGYRPACARRATARPDAVTGLLSPHAIRDVVQRNLGQVSACYDAALTGDPSAQGRVGIRFVIGGDGAVVGSGVTEAPASLRAAAACIAQALRAWRFPAPEGGGVVTVNYPFNLGPPG